MGSAIKEADLVDIEQNAEYFIQFSFNLKL